MSKKNLKRIDNSCHDCKYAKWDEEKTQSVTKKLYMGKCTFPLRIDYSKFPAAIQISLQPIREDSVFHECPMFEPNTDTKK